MAVLVRRLAMADAELPRAWMGVPVMAQRRSACSEKHAFAPAVALFLIM